MAFEPQTPKLLSQRKKAGEFVERRRFPRVPYRDYPAAFVTQVMDGVVRDRSTPLVQAPRNPATEAYNRGTTLGALRAPAGISHRQDI